MAFDMFSGGKSTSETQSTFVDSFGVQNSYVSAPAYSNVGNVTIQTASNARLPTGNAVADTLQTLAPIIGLLLIAAAFLYSRK